MTERRRTFRRKLADQKDLPRVQPIAGGRLVGEGLRMETRGGRMFVHDLERYLARLR